MKIITVLSLVFLIIVKCVYAYADYADEPAFNFKATHTQKANIVPLYEVFEITFQHDQKYENPFFDLAIEVNFISPSGKQIKVGGFHYGSLEKPAIKVQKIQTSTGERQNVEYIFDKQNIWKARFAPSEIGEWRYSYLFSNLKGSKANGEGDFLCVKGKVQHRGFIRQNPANPFRLIFDDGSPYFPVGLQECLGDNSANGSVLDTASLEGPFRTDLKEPPPLPPGSMFVRGPSNNPLNGDIYFRRYGRCGFNLFRFSQKNCSYSLYNDLDHYLTQESLMTDELLTLVRKYNLRIFYGLFGYQKVFNDQPDNIEGVEKVKRFIKYTVDRWGAYVDFWEFLNEQNADDKWYEIMTPYLQSIDPYHHPITTSWERPNLPGIELNAPHWYQNEDELQSDSITASKASNWKRYNKPVIVGEQGNFVDRNKPRPLGVGGVWDLRSALRMRIRLWTALFNEIALIFWNTSYAKDGHNMNLWLGAKEREYVRALQDFSYRLDKEVKITPVEISEPNNIRAYGLASKDRFGVYLHHFKDHDAPVKSLRITIDRSDAPDVSKSAKGYWYSPETAKILKTFEVSKGKITLEVPEFMVDIALLITPNGPPDIDSDGMPNDIDPDDDNDGITDEKDAFPLEPEEWVDKDGDLIGDNLDADDDADGIGDDENKNGIPDHEELDFDGDGVLRSNAIPWDAFPFDPKEWRDTDGDGIGDNSDADDEAMRR